MSESKTQRLTLSSGFTLIELVVVLTIILILAGVVAPRVANWGERACFAQAATDMRSINRALDYMYTDVGFYPSEVGNGVEPGLLTRTRVPNARRDDWNGPYIERWPDENPFGGTYDYDYTNYNALNFDGSRGNEVLITMQGGYTTEQAQEVDEILDDGNTGTGSVRIRGNALVLYVGEGPSW